MEAKRRQAFQVFVYKQFVGWDSFGLGLRAINVGALIRGILYDKYNNKDPPPPQKKKV